jgi:hypothetical protein
MMLPNVLPNFAGVLLPTGPRLVVTGKAGGAVAPGDAVESTDGGKTWTAASTEVLGVAATDVNMKGIAVFDPKKGLTSYASGDVFSICLFGVITAKAVATSGILVGRLVKASVAAGTPGQATLGVAASVAADVHDNLPLMYNSMLGVALSAPAATAGALFWLFVGVRM